MAKKKPAAEAKKTLGPTIRVTRRAHYLMGIVASVKGETVKDATTAAVDAFAVAFLQDRNIRPDPVKLAEFERLDAEEAAS